MAKSPPIAPTEESQIWDLIDQLIETANNASDQGLDAGAVHQAMMYACARYGAFIVASASETVEDFVQDRDDAKRFYLDQFRRLLLENFDEYQENFGNYLDG
ncbi:DUF3144 domain-containing protein [Halioxenophilus sp. WMMB6]|uniref:DUF3144 domain-containing protein n=1 Tax=Halioxenophilus sp. WMMB6 TaxID=3073815 RepID=UPI00295EC2C3|nr:DUF3144 domain-containing protein [Halioxenophilus sp. WMMB6]